jgi:hypothetical protein
VRGTSRDIVSADHFNVRRKIMNETFDLVARLVIFDFVLFKIYRGISESRAKGDRRIFYPASVVLIGLLGNTAPLVCSVHMALAPVTVGGIALVVLLMSDGKSPNPFMASNLSTNSTLASGTPDAGHQSRHP